MPKTRIPPSQRLSKEIMELINNLNQYSNPQETFGKIVHLGIRKLVQELLEKEIQEHIGKAYYEQGDRDGYRNGYKPDRLKTAENLLSIEKPQITANEIPFQSQLWPIILDCA